MSSKYDEWSRKASLVMARGRTIDEQADFIKAYGNHSVPSLLRGGLFKALEIPLPKKRAENLVVFGCYVPITNPFLVRDYVRVFDMLGIDYTYLRQEHCCGLPILVQSSKIDRKKAFATAREVAQLNASEASEKGAHTLAYCCEGCAHINKYVFPKEAGRHVYVLDLIIDKLANRPMKVAPTTVAYFEGCHAYSSLNYPKVRLGWKRYRQVLGTIEGLKIVDLPNKHCCRNEPDQMVDDALRAGADTILCSCNACYTYIESIAKADVRMMSFPEILLKGLLG